MSGTTKGYLMSVLKSAASSPVSGDNWAKGIAERINSAIKTEVPASHRLAVRTAIRNQVKAFGNVLFCNK